jgi:mannose-6-phosphate isomerase
VFVPITNEPRDYAWGSTELLAEYLGRPASGGPEAELWLGAHPASPARVTGGEHAGLGLDAAIDAAGGAQPSILLKVLAAGEPLSLQAHPDASTARAGFAREEAAGIPRDAPNRSYRDPFAKPEVIVAVSRFEALSGFRPADEALAVLEALVAIDERAAPVLEHVRAGDALAWLLSGTALVAEVVDAAVSAAPVLAASHPAEADTISRLATTHPGDPGIVIALLLNRVSLAPGEALFLPAGNLHAYLEGLGVELMGPSDNVLRCGLTSKHVDVDELLAVVDSAPLLEPRLAAERLDGATAYRPGSPFELRHVSGAHAAGSGRGILLAVAPVRATVDGVVHELASGSAAWIETDEPIALLGDDAWLALER